VSADDDRKVERPAFLATGACAAVLAWAFFGGDLDGPIAAIAALLLAGAVVVALAGPRREVRVDGAVALTLASLAVTGQVRDRAPFGLGAIVTAAACLYAMRRVRAPVGPRATRWLPLAAVIGAGAPLAASLALGLPPLSRAIEGRIAEYLASAPIGNQTGFAADHMPVGSTVGLLVDDTIVLRVRGDTSELLRGEVYDAYVERGGWTSTLGDTTDVDAKAAAGPSASITGEETDRFFVPHTHACVRTTSGRARVSSGGVFRPAMGESGRRVTTSADCVGRAAGAAAPPGPADLDVPKSMTPLLDDTLDRWKVRANFGVAAQLARIERGLADEHAYALDVPRDDRIDPVVDFLTKHPSGHCELFASTGALLARRAGIPARVVAGYRVVEKSRVGDWYVVRKSHAHAWIETWDGARWVALDPTPAREEPAHGERGLLASLRDLAGAIADETRARVSGTALVLAISGVTAAVIFGRELRRRLRDRQRTRRRGPTDALPAFRELSGALARRGIERAPGEPLERFSRRVVASEEPWAMACAEAIGAYAALRYGDEGDEDEVAQKVRDTASLL
jgi:hypothetical protein